jgi:hypothetical protein
MYKPHGFPYVCSYLGHLLKHEKITSKQVLLDRIEEMDNWIAANLTRNGVEEWYYSNKNASKSGMCWICSKAGRAFHLDHPKTGLETRISRYIFFKTGEDLLAFKLRFGIHREYSSNNVYKMY